MSLSVDIHRSLVTRWNWKRTAETEAEIKQCYERMRKSES